MEKYEKDVEAKQHELDVLKASKAKDLDKLQELTKLVSTCLLPPKIRKFNTLYYRKIFTSYSLPSLSLVLSISLLMRNLSFMEHIFIFQYKEYEQVVVEDRIEKEKARRKADQEAIELRAAIRVRQLSKQNH